MLTTEKSSMKLEQIEIALKTLSFLKHFKTCVYPNKKSVEQNQKLDQCVHLCVKTIRTLLLTHFFK